MRAWIGLALTMGFVACATTGFVAPCAAQDFYKDKTVEMIVSTGVGGGLDNNARLVARYLPAHLPGKPTIVVRNMPGAGHVRAANYLFNQAAKDGTSIATLIPAFVLAQVLDGRGMQFDAAKFQWLGSTSSSNSTVYVWSATGVRSVDDVKAKEVLMGATGAGSYTTLYPTVMNNILGTKFKIIAGYQSAAEVNLAMERGEIEGRAGNNFNSLKAENAEWLRSGKIRLIAQVGLTREPEFPDVPLISDFAKAPSDHEIMKLFSADVVIGRPFLAPPGVPPERIKILRDALDAVVRDPGFLADAKTAGLDVIPVGGLEIQKVVEDLVHTPADVIAKAKLAMQTKDYVDPGKPGDKKGP
jgi:tripartite-type tricarboxylate transporter receptor subunit TctC